MLADRCLLLEGRAGGHQEEACQGDPCPRDPRSPSPQAAGSTPEAPSADLAPQGRGTNPELSRRHSTQPTAHMSSHAHISRRRRQTRTSRENTTPSHGQTHPDHYLGRRHRAPSGDRSETEGSQDPRTWQVPCCLLPWPTTDGQPVPVQGNVRHPMRPRPAHPMVLKDGGPGLPWVPPS